MQPLSKNPELSIGNATIKEKSGIVHKNGNH
jgi:hypothetical protein